MSKTCTFCGFEEVIKEGDERLEYYLKELAGRDICELCYDAGLLEAGPLGEYARSMMESSESIINKLTEERNSLQVLADEVTMRRKERTQLNKRYSKLEAKYKKETK